MSKAKHTPAPWRVEVPSDSNVFSLAVRWGFNALTFQPDVKQPKSNNLVSWYAAPLAVIQCWQQLFLER